MLDCGTIGRKFRMIPVKKYSKITRKVKPNFFLFNCVKCSQLVGYEESKVNFKVECKAKECKR